MPSDVGVCDTAIQITAESERESLPDEKEEACQNEIPHFRAVSSFHHRRPTDRLSLGVGFFFQICT